MTDTVSQFQRKMLAGHRLQRFSGAMQAHLSTHSPVPPSHPQITQRKPYRQMAETQHGGLGHARCSFHDHPGAGRFLGGVVRSVPQFGLCSKNYVSELKQFSQHWQLSVDWLWLRGPLYG